MNDDRRELHEIVALLKTVVKNQERIIDAIRSMHSSEQTLKHLAKEWRR